MRYNSPKKGLRVKKTIALILFVMLVFAGVVLISDRAERVSPSHDKPRIAVSSFVLYDIVTHLAGERVEPFMVVPFGRDLHSFEPTPKDLAILSRSLLFVYSGAGLEPWAEAFAHDLRTLNVSKFVTLRHLDDGEHGEHEADVTAEAVHGDEEHAGHHHEEIDPHYWLDPINMIQATKAVEQQLAQLIPDYAGEFHRNGEIYITQLHMLDNRFKSELSGCKQPMIVVNHNAFGYLSERYGFEVVALTGLSPESMPSAKRMAELSDLVEEYQLNTIFFESFVSDRLIKEIARETGAKVDTLQPLGNITADEAAQKLNYVQLMERNLVKIKTAMECP